VQKFKQNQHAAKFQKFFTLFFSTLHQTDCDKIGRVFLPQNLRSAIGIGKEIVVAGVMDKIELWPKEIYDRNLKDLLAGKSLDMSLAKMTEEAFGLLNEEIEEEPSVEPTTAMNPVYFEVPTK
jgi:MraZ protein